MDPKLPPFPVDDVTLDAVEHSLAAYLTFEGENGEELAEPRVAGADFQLDNLLDFYAGAVGDDPNGYQIEPGGFHVPGISGMEIWMDTRPTYTHKDVIHALIAEVRRLRGSGDRPGGA